MEQKTSNSKNNLNKMSKAIVTHFLFKITLQGPSPGGLYGKTVCS